MSKRPVLGRSKSERGLDQFDTPPIAPAPLFAHEPLLAGVTAVCEPFCGKGNLVTAMRARGFTVHASDVVSRGCPDSRVLDFWGMTERPTNCDVLVSNPPYAKATQIIEHGFALGFRVVILLLKANFAGTEERYARLHRLGHMRRVHVLAERLQDMHDANFTGKKASQSQEHSWFVFDRNYCGPATLNPVSIKSPAARLPWQSGRTCERCRKSYQPQRSTSRFCSSACRQRAHHKRLSVTPSVTPAPSEVFRYVRHADVSRFSAEGWQATPALEGTHHGGGSNGDKRGGRADAT
jgi:hypothetical protein